MTFIVKLLMTLCRLSEPPMYGIVKLSRGLSRIDSIRLTLNGSFVRVERMPGTAWP
jgi:hypothetical protein